ncbi:MAG: nicotinate-nucleotide diphosphorylase (carboxylating), partial [Pseudomonadales bacterium]
QYTSKLAGTGTKILDTRKTIPGLRLAQKYAVKAGGAENHRIGLYDAFLIKENHIAACGSIKAAVEKARKIAPDVLLEVEVENLEELKIAIEAGVDRVMLDNFSDDQIAKAVELKPTGIKYEVSGNITNTGLTQGKFSGIDFVSSGALTKNVQAIDLSLRVT